MVLHRPILDQFNADIVWAWGKSPFSSYTSVEAQSALIETDCRKGFFHMCSCGVQHSAWKTSKVHVHQLIQHKTEEPTTV